MRTPGNPFRARRSVVVPWRVARNCVLFVLGFWVFAPVTVSQTKANVSKPGKPLEKSGTEGRGGRSAAFLGECAFSGARGGWYKSEYIPHEDTMSQHDTRSPLLTVFLPLAALVLGVPLLIYATGGFFAYFLGVVGFLGFVGLIHWVTWGRALTEEVAGEREEEVLRQKALEEDWPAADPYGIRKK
jgi:hypothetical protein